MQIWEGKQFRIKEGTIKQEMTPLQWLNEISTYITDEIQKDDGCKAEDTEEVVELVLSEKIAWDNITQVRAWMTNTAIGPGMTNTAIISNII